uniref:Putative plant transposon protein domain-containing protein n=1 Tax=Solanum tuberosum TaxID=4113 RepID=M1D8Y2_SOLTU
MAPKAKAVAGSKRSRKGEAFGSSNAQEPVQKFGKKVVERYGWEWFACQQEAKYMGDEFVNEVRLQSQFPVIYQTVLDLGLSFIFDNPGDCNLMLVREFYANWLTETKYKNVPVRGKDVKFSARNLNELLGTPNCDPDEFNNMKDKPPYRDIRHTLCGVDSAARWERSKDTRRHNTLHFANLNQVARVWLKIVCSVLLPAKHLTDVTRDRVVLVYMLMKGMSINVGTILSQNMMKFRNNLRWRFCYGELITRFLRAEGIEEEIVDMTIAYHSDLTGGRPATDAEMETMAERYPLIESASFLCRTGPAFLEPLDDDEATADETMDDEEDDAVDEEANALMVFDRDDNEA